MRYNDFAMNVSKVLLPVLPVVGDENPEVNVGKFSDGDHTFDDLYYHRMMLFAVICNTYPQCAWKSWKHEDGTMYDDYFIVGITTPDGDYSYHYHKDYWNNFNVPELENAPHWDGHKPEDIGRIFSLLGRYPDKREAGGRFPDKWEK